MTTSTATEVLTEIYSSTGAVATESLPFWYFIVGAFIALFLLVGLVKAILYAARKVF